MLIRQALRPVLTLPQTGSYWQDRGANYAARLVARRRSLRGMNSWHWLKASRPVSLLSILRLFSLTHPRTPSMVVLLSVQLHIPVAQLRGICRHSVARALVEVPCAGWRPSTYYIVIGTPSS